MSKKVQTQNNGNKRENLSKKLSDLRQTVALPVIGNVTIKIDDIEDVQMTNVNGKLKIKIIYKDNDGYKYTVVGATFLDQVNECIKNANEMEITRDAETLKTYIECH